MTWMHLQRKEKNDMHAKQIFYEGKHANINFGRVSMQNLIFKRVCM